MRDFIWKAFVVKSYWDITDKIEPKSLNQQDNIVEKDCKNIVAKDYILFDTCWWHGLFIARTCL